MMIKQLNFTTDDNVTHSWINPNDMKETDDDIIYVNASVYYATLEGILNAAKRYYIHKE